jgi:hypothetical protein
MSGIERKRCQTLRQYRKPIGLFGVFLTFEIVARYCVGSR